MQVSLLFKQNRLAPDSCIGCRYVIDGVRHKRESMQLRLTLVRRSGQRGEDIVLAQEANLLIILGVPGLQHKNILFIFLRLTDETGVLLGVR